MWRVVCTKCDWHSGEVYLQSMAVSIGRVHEEDNAGHKVTLEEIAGTSWMGVPNPPKPDSKP
jgi:hypothetical protein